MQSNLIRQIVLLHFVMLSLCCFAQNTNGWDTAWTSSFGGYEVDYGRDIKETPDKGFILAGTSSSFGDGNTSFYIIKTDSLGRHKWSKAIGTAANDLAYSVELAKDGGYFFAGTSNWDVTKGYDAYLIKTDASGQVLWTKNYGGNDWDFFYKACAMPDGGLVLCGESYSQTHGGSDAYLVRVDANGDTLWTRKFGGTGNDAFYAIKRNSGRLYVAGHSTDASGKKYNASVYKLDFNGQVLKNEFFAGNTVENMTYLDIELTKTGRILLAGSRDSDTTERCILRKVDTTNLAEVYYMTTNLTIHFNTVLEGNNGDMYVIGPSRAGFGGLGAHIFRYDSVFTQLNYAWLGGKHDEDGFELIRSSKGGYAFVGMSTTYGNVSNSKLENVMLVVTNKPDLSSNYFTLLTEHYDNLSPVNVTEQFATKTLNLTIYPNPVVGTLNLEWADEAAQHLRHITISNLIGETVWQDNKRNHLLTQTRQLDLSGLTGGVYFLKISSLNESDTILKFIKK